MANVKEITIPNISIHFSYLEDALSAVLHTILFVRAPNIGMPRDQSCKSLKPLVYAKCGPVDVDQTVNTTVDIFRKSVKCLEEGLYHGELILSFFDKRETKEYLGFVTKHENVYFEKWKISIELTDSRYQRTEPMDAVQQYQNAYAQVTKSILHITEAVNQSTDHVPLTLYDYEIQVLELTSGTGASDCGSIVSKLINSPAIFQNL